MTVSNEHDSNTPQNLRDRWCTPDWLYEWANKNLFSMTVDVAASSDNKKCDKFIGEEMDALSTSWLVHSDDTGWCNPPYSDIAPWVKKAWHEARKGFKIVMLIPTPNGESYYGKYIFGKASQIIYINGRIAFEAAEDFTVKGKNGKPDKAVKKGEAYAGNPRGSCLVVFDRMREGQTAISHVNRDDMKLP